MRITSPKNIPLQNTKFKNLNKEHKFQRANQNASNSNLAYQSQHVSRHSSPMDRNKEYGLNSKQSNMTQPISIKRARSNSKFGISMSRNKTIRIDNIYEPQHFGETIKNSENYSTKSITQASKYAKSVSRITRATSPTITHFTQQRQDQNTRTNSFSINSTSMRDINPSEAGDFNFKDLKRQINNMNYYGADFLQILPQEQEYYSGKTYQLKQFSKQNEINSRNQKMPIRNQVSIQNHEYNLSHKVHHIGSSKNIRGANEESRNFNNLKRQQTTNYQTPYEREKSLSDYFEVCSNLSSHQIAPLLGKKPSKPTSSSKLNCKDVIRK